MKTTKIISVLGLSLILAATTAGFSKNVQKSDLKGSTAPGIRYQVNVHLSTEKSICNTYLVQVVDETGRLVAAPQVFVPGVTSYAFMDTGNGSGNKRIAMLVMATYPSHFVCANDLFTTPDVENGPFLLGRSYAFDLYPSFQAIKE